MLASAMNFVIGFFGYPFDGMYEQSITIEEPGVSALLLLSRRLLILTSSTTTPLHLTTHATTPMSTRRPTVQPGM